MNVIFLGTPEFAVAPLKAILASKHRVLAVISQPDRETDKKGNLKPTPVKAFALSQGLSVLQYGKASGAEALTAIRALKPDIMVTAAFGQLLSEEFLAVAPVYNIHASLLPRYRGSAPIQAAILGGETKTGVTVMKTVKAMDAGDIVLQDEIAVGEQEPFYGLHDRLSELGARLIIKALDQTENGSVTFTPQDHEEATYTKKITKADGLIDWSEPADLICRKVRAFNPWPAGYTYYCGDNIKIQAAESIEIDTMRDILPKIVKNILESAEPGTVLCADEKSGLIVRCGGGALRIKTLQAPGKRALAAAEFLRGYKIAEGYHFSKTECE